MIDVQVAGDTDIAEVQRLLREYAAWVGVDLSFQDFEQEVAHLPGDYVAPGGVLLVARVDGAVAGCVAAHAWRADVCEMKRLFVGEAHRGTGCGRALVDGILDWARQAGYQSVVLDTLPVMDQAQQLYRRLGFRDIEAYRPNPVPGARWLERSLV